MTNQDVRQLVRQNGNSVSLLLDKFPELCARSKTSEIQKICALAAAAKVSAAPLSGDAVFELRLGGRLIVNHSGGVLENAGLCLHRFFNYPLIPGSALKGIARHYAGQIKIDPLQIRRIFGDDTQEGGGGGTVAFIAAVPADKNWKLIADILTPHKDDFSNPVPIPFMAVDKGANFRFILKKTSRGTAADLEFAARLLKEALCENGVGSKTSSGYGWFHEVKK